MRPFVRLLWPLVLICYHHFKPTKHKAAGGENKNKKEINTEMALILAGHYY